MVKMHNLQVYSLQRLDSVCALRELLNNLMGAAPWGVQLPGLSWGHMAELEITVGHRPFSGQIAKLTDRPADILA